MKNRALARYLDAEISRGTVRIPNIVSEEWHANIGRMILSSLGDMEPVTSALDLADMAHASFRDLLADSALPDSLDKRDDFVAMYDGIWGDPLKSGRIAEWRRKKFRNWSRKNRRLIERHPRGRFTPLTHPPGPPKGNDLVILSTAASLAESSPARPLTFDYDFIAFEEEIRRLGVEVISGYGLPP